MVTVLSTKMTKAGQTTVPKEIRDSLGISTDARVYWYWDGDRVFLSPTPLPPTEITSEKDFRNGLKAAEDSIKTHGTHPFDDTLSNLRGQYGIDK